MRKHFPLLVGGVASIGRYLESVREAPEPDHHDTAAALRRAS